MKTIEWLAVELKHIEKQTIQTNMAADHKYVVPSGHWACKWTPALVFVIVTLGC